MRDHFSKVFILGLGFLLSGQAAAQQGAYFVLGTGMPVTIERLDPLLSAGKVPSQHVHSVVGGNAFTSTMDFATTQKSTCATVQPKADKSNYWMPNLYFHNPTTKTFTRVREQPYHKIYYKYGNGANQYDTDIQEFPQEFRMIAGDATLRSLNSTAMGPYGTELGWFCHGNGTSQFPDVNSVGFPTGFTACPNGLAAAITMPSCWNGQAFDATNPSGHMRYPTADGITGCPVGYRVARFPQIFVEYWLNVNTFDGMYGKNDQPFVLSMGDPTGFGFHVDFLNGWTPAVLNETMKTCRPGNTGNPPLSDASCFGNRGGIFTDAEIKACLIPGAVNEDVGWTYPEIDNPQGGVLTKGGELQQLPGCQTIQGAPGPATLKTC
ncbi:hypothetical protein MMC10_005915 [Thelotrema lepadinum]|nr:hypothetical protein [Thelotrema lepadinum]